MSRKLTKDEINYKDLKQNWSAMLSKTNPFVGHQNSFCCRARAPSASRPRQKWPSGLRLVGGGPRTPSCPGSGRSRCFRAN